MWRRYTLEHVGRYVQPQDVNFGPDYLVMKGACNVRNRRTPAQNRLSTRLQTARDSPVTRQQRKGLCDPKASVNEVRLSFQLLGGQRLAVALGQGSDIQSKPGD